MIIVQCGSHVKRNQPGLYLYSSQRTRHEQHEAYTLAWAFGHAAPMLLLLMALRLLDFAVNGNIYPNISSLDASIAC